ncbi:uncharacterized protein LOC131061549 [Cryptomeria japonica]|uniref:uncharacterized protein LOC131061549 n=1 Tax=Cryptomeria japonica TaxID=3369 RepID=UPI0027DA9E90|nr:uncharacterized protein LOC131061549 [Cryptomeria japonica]
MVYVSVLELRDLQGVWHVSGTHERSNLCPGFPLSPPYPCLFPYLPWIVAGDFNAILDLTEKRGGNTRLDPSSFLLRDNISALNLVDIKPSNGRFTWNNRREGDRCIAERLDRFMVSYFWVGGLWSSSSEILDWRGSDHWPIKLVTSSARLPQKPPFKFQLMWLRDPDLYGCVAEWWQVGRPTFGTAMYVFAKLLQYVKYQLKRWNQQCFGNIYQVKQEAQVELNGITRLIREEGVSEYLLREEARALKALEEWELREEIFWKQKARIEWLKEGDKNTTFFFNSVKARQHGNAISSLVTDRGEVISSTQGIADEAVQYFASLFREEAQGDSVAEAQVLSCIPSLVYLEMKQYLMSVITLEELEKIVFQMKKAERLKKGLTVLISEEQSGFVEGRQILDGVVVATETIHSMASSKAKAMFIKLDMAKAYDRVRWSFLQKVLSAFGFEEEWICWVMSCVGSTSFSVLINGEHSNLFGASRGLRQGDPLSPYLFLLLVEGLGRLIKRNVEGGFIQGWQWGGGIPVQSHLQFVDDTALMGLATIREASNMRRALDVYLAASGQLINEGKSSIFFFNTPPSIQRRIAHILRFQIGSLPLLYLGIPISTGRQSRDSWQVILDKFNVKVNHWTHRWLSFAGRVQLLQSVFLWAGNLSSTKWSLIKWETVCSPKRFGGLGLRQSLLSGIALAAKLYWRWCVEQDRVWARILSHKYFFGIPQRDIPRYSLAGKGSTIWNTLKKGAVLIKGGFFWICKSGTKAQFWHDSWDGYPPIVSQYPHLSILAQRFCEAGWTRVCDFKSFSLQGQVVEARWKTSREWPILGLEVECAELHNILSGRSCSALMDSDVLAWSPNPKGTYTVSSGYQALLSQQFASGEVHWWKRVWNNFSWPKCNCFSWTLAWNRCLTWDNIQKRGFAGPSRCVLCGGGEEDSPHLFFRCPFTLQLWHFWWDAWKSQCFHASSLAEFWMRLGRPPSSAPFLQEVWYAGPIFLLWQVWLERNRRIFRGEQLGIQQVWTRIMGMVQETVKAKSEIILPMEEGDAEIVNRFGIQGISPASACARRGRRVKHRVQRMGKWLPPPAGFLKINTDGSSRGNPGPTGIGGIGRDSSRSVVFIFSANEGVQTVNRMEGLAILYALKRAYALGWRKVICEADSQILVNLLLQRKMSEVSWQLSVLVQQILQVSSVMDSVSFTHIPREWNRAADCLAKWASEDVDDRRIDEWEQLPYELCQDLEKILVEDESGVGE